MAHPGGGGDDTDLASRIAAAWQHLASQPQEWIRLARIRALLDTPDEGQLRQTLITMIRTGMVHLALLGPLPGLDLTGIGWVITGGESGPRARPVDPRWVRDIRDTCQRHGVAFFHKQWGGRTPKAGGRVLDGRTWDQYPDLPAGTGVAR